MGMLKFLSPATSRAPTSAPASLLERYLCFCRRTGSVGIDRGLSVCIVYSRQPGAERIDPWPATEPEVCEILQWSEERLLLACTDYIKAHHFRAGEADYLLCRILNECEHRLGRPISLHPFIESAEAVLDREPLVKSLTSVAEPETATALLRQKYGLGDIVMSGSARDVAKEVERLLRPILVGLACHPKFLCFEVNNEPSEARHQTQGISCWLDYTVIHARFAHAQRPITLCVFSHSCAHDGDDAYYILATQHPRIVEYLRGHANSG